MKPMREQVADVLMDVATRSYYHEMSPYQAGLWAADLILALPGITVKEPEPESNT